MLIIIFIALASCYYIFWHLENRRNARNEEQHERRREAFTNLLDSLKIKEEKTDNKNDT